MARAHRKLHAAVSQRGGDVAPGRHIFISYKRGPRSTPAAERLQERFEVQLPVGSTAFFDRRSIEAGEPWQDAIDTYMARATHCLALISIGFWRSQQCRRELDLALQGYAAGGRPRLLLVLAERLDPNELSLDQARAQAELDADTEAQVPLQRIRSLGQLNFLGPHDTAGRLVRLKFEDDLELDDQLAELVAEIKRLPD